MLVLGMRAVVEEDDRRGQTGEQRSVDQAKACPMGWKREKVVQAQQRLVPGQARSHTLDQEVKDVGEQLVEVKPRLP